MNVFLQNQKQEAKTSCKGEHKISAGSYRKRHPTYLMQTILLNSFICTFNAQVKMMFGMIFQDFTIEHVKYRCIKKISGPYLNSNSFMHMYI